MAIIKLLTGTTEDYKETEDILILDEREIAVEIVTDGDDSSKKYFNIRQGDGHSTFFDLPIIVNNERMEKLNVVMSEYYDSVRNFSTSMTTSASLANQAAESANQAATKAENAAKKIDDSMKGFNDITDDTDGIVYRFGIESGIVYLESVD